MPVSAQIAAQTAAPQQPSINVPINWGPWQDGKFYPHPPQEVQACVNFVAVAAPLLNRQTGQRSVGIGATVGDEEAAEVDFFAARLSGVLGVSVSGSDVNALTSARNSASTLVCPVAAPVVLTIFAQRLSQGIYAIGPSSSLRDQLIRKVNSCSKILSYFGSIPVDCNYLLDDLNDTIYKPKRFDSSGVAHGKLCRASTRVSPASPFGIATSIGTALVPPGYVDGSVDLNATDWKVKCRACCYDAASKGLIRQDQLLACKAACKD